MNATAAVQQGRLRSSIPPEPKKKAPRKAAKKNAPTLKSYAFPVEAKSLECDDYN